MSVSDTLMSVRGILVSVVAIWRVCRMTMSVTVSHLGDPLNSAGTSDHMHLRSGPVSGSEPPYGRGDTRVIHAIPGVGMSGVTTQTAKGRPLCHLTLITIPGADQRYTYPSS